MVAAIFGLKSHIKSVVLLNPVLSVVSDHPWGVWITDSGVLFQFWGP